MISGHIAGLTTGPRGLLTLLALLGPAPPALLADASGRELADVLDGLARLAASGLSQPGPDGWTPGHERISQVLTATLDPASKACVHARLAQALRHRGAEPAEIAGHLLASGDRDEASAAYAAAATRRLGCFADDEALRLADAGLSLQPTGPARRHLLETRAETRRRRGMLAGARADLKAALEACDDAADRSRILTDLALLEARSVSVARGEELAELAIAEAQDHPGARGQALATAAIIDLPAGNLARAERHLLRARRLLEQVGETRGTARLLYCQAMASYMAGRLREAATRLGDLAHLPVIPAEVRLWSPQATRGHVLALLAEPEAGLAEITEALTWARAHVTRRWQANACGAAARRSRSPGADEAARRRRKRWPSPLASGTRPAPPGRSAVLASPGKQPGKRTRPKWRSPARTAANVPASRPQNAGGRGRGPAGRSPAGRRGLGTAAIPRPRPGIIAAARAAGQLPGAACGRDSLDRACQPAATVRENDP